VILPARSRNFLPGDLKPWCRWPNVKLEGFSAEREAPQSWFAPANSEPGCDEELANISDASLDGSGSLGCNSKETAIRAHAQYSSAVVCARGTRQNYAMVDHKQAPKDFADAESVRDQRGRELDSLRAVVPASCPIARHRATCQIARAGFKCTVSPQLNAARETCPAML